MPDIQADQEVDELINYKVRKRVAKKVMKDIHQQVDEIEQQVQTENTAKKFLLPSLLLLTSIIALFVFLPSLLRVVSGLFNY